MNGRAVRQHGAGNVGWTRVGRSLAIVSSAAVSGSARPRCCALNCCGQQPQGGMRTCRGDAWPGHAVAPIAGRLSIRRLLPPEETTVAASGAAARYRKSSHWGLPVPIDQGVRGGRSPKPSAPRVEAPVRFAWVVATATLVPFCAIGIRVHGGARSLALYQRVIVAIDIDGKVAFRCHRALGASPASPATPHRTRAGPAAHHICPPRRESPTLTGVGGFSGASLGTDRTPILFVGELSVFGHLLPSSYIFPHRGGL